MFCEAFAKYDVRERVALNLPACSLLTALNCAGDEHSICMQKENGKDALTVIYESSDSIVQLGCLFHSNNVSFVVSGVYQFCFFCFWFLFSLLCNKQKSRRGQFHLHLMDAEGERFTIPEAKYTAIISMSSKRFKVTLFRVELHQTPTFSLGLVLV